MKFSGIAIGSFFLVLSILLTLKPVSPGTAQCVILPKELSFLAAYARNCGKVVAECPIFVDKNGDGNYMEKVFKDGRWRMEWDDGERPGVGGCDCAENYCTDWCTNDVCKWIDDQGNPVAIKTPAAICHVTTAMPHCTGAVICPSEGTAPCTGEGCGLVPAGGCCLKDSDCVTYYSGGPSKCTIQTNDCYSWEGYQEHSTTLTENPGYACACSNLNEPCGTSVDCCDNNIDGQPDFECRDSICSAL